MKTIVKNGRVFDGEALTRQDILIEDGLIQAVGLGLDETGCQIIDAQGQIVSPGFVDLHVHLRDPGFAHKETVETGSMAAAAGGFTTICAMPNLNPVPDSPEHLQVSLDRIQEGASVRALPYCSITEGEKGEKLVDFEALAGKCAGFSDDGKGVQQGEMMRQAMIRCAKLDALICAHCEDESLLDGGYIHQGEYASLHGHKGICSASEYEQVRRDAAYALETGCRYHVCHVSAKETLEIVRQAKAAGARVSCEITPHHALLCDMDIAGDEGRFKMNPPLRSAEDRAAIWRALRDGTADAFATDHAPHSAEEKSRGLAGSAMGIVGLETAFPVLYTGLVKKGILSIERLLWMLTYGPSRVLGIPCGVVPGNRADLVFIDENTIDVVDSRRFYSMGRSTPFEGMETQGRVVRTVCQGKTVYREER